MKIQKKKTVLLNELAEQFDTYEELYSWIQQQLTEGTLTAKGKTFNDHIHPLPLQYWEHLDTSCIRQYKDEILQTFPLYCSPEYYLNHIMQYRLHSKDLHQLMQWSLRTDHQQLISVHLPEKERFYEIWGREKFPASRASALLKNLNLPDDYLHCSARPIPSSRLFLMQNLSNPTILILENKDTFCSVCERLQEGQTTFFGIPINGALCGDGAGITSVLQDLIIQHSDTINSAHFYYFGDLDWYGIDIFARTQNQFPDLTIDLFTPGYQFLLNTVRSIQDLQRTREHQNRMARQTPAFINAFLPDEQTQIQSILTNGYYIPQEALNKRLLALHT